MGGSFLDIYKYYKSPEWFQLEQEQLFEKCWLFAGLSTSLTSPDQFLRRKILGRDLLFRRDRTGRLTCRINRCRHRGGPFVLEDSGQRGNICRYHCWRYDDQGNLTNIPNAAEFNEQHQLPSVCLDPISTLEIGAFIFINFGTAPRSFESQYGTDVSEILKKISDTLENKYSYTHFNCKYNWKLNFENVIDGNHISFVHPSSFGHIVGNVTNKTSSIIDSIWFANETGTMRNLDFFNNHTYPPDDIKSLSCLSRRELKYSERWYSKEIPAIKDKGGHLALQLFPNCNIGSIHGEMYYLQFYEPVSPDQTTFHSWVATARTEATFESKLPSLLWGMHHSEKKVIDEDRVILEATHAALSPGVEQTLGDFDANVHRFRSWLVSNIYEPS